MTKVIALGLKLFLCPYTPFAVGSKSFVEMIGEQMTDRSQLDIEKGTSGNWIIKETQFSYNDFSASKNASN